MNDHGGTSTTLSINKEAYGWVWLRGQQLLYGTKMDSFESHRRTWTKLISPTKKIEWKKLIAEENRWCDLIIRNHLWGCLGDAVRIFLL